jgi:hypothetical protein
MSSSLIYAKNFQALNKNSLMDSSVKEIGNNKTEISFSIDQTKLLINGLIFLTHNAPNYMHPRVVYANINDSAKTVPSFAYFASLFQQAIDKQILDATIQHALNTPVIIRLGKYSELSSLQGQIQYVNVKIVFG